MKCKCLFILIFTVLSTKAQFPLLSYTDVDFKENQADTLTVKLDNILLVGIGSSLERIFLNDLSDKLIKDFASKQIKASYVYLGRTTEEARKNYNDIVTGTYNTILFFSPTDTSVFDIKNITSRVPIPRQTNGATVTFNRNRNRITYQQSFDIVLFETGKEMTKIWEASVDIDCKPDKKNGAKKLGDKILTRFKFNNYIE